MWNSGSTTSCTVSGVIMAGMPRFTQFQKFMPCVMMAPFGCPVVPEVYITMAMSSWVSATGGAGGGADASARS